MSQRKKATSNVIVSVKPRLWIIWRGRDTGVDFNIKIRSHRYRIENTTVAIRQWWDRLISTMAFLVLIKMHLPGTGPWVVLGYEKIKQKWFAVYGLLSIWYRIICSKAGRFKTIIVAKLKIPTNWFCLPLNSTSSKIYFKRLLWFTTIPELFDPMWPNDAVLWHIFWPILHQVIPCCLTAPSHYLNFWLFNHEVQWQSHEDNFTKSLHEPILTFLSILPLGTWHQDNSAINY